MSYLSEAHAEWHAVNGAYAICPLDCGAISPAQREAEDLMDAIAYEDDPERGAKRTIRCAHCKDRHATVDAVRACGRLHELQAERDAS